METGRSQLAGGLIIVAAASLFGSLGLVSRTAYGLGLSPIAFVAWRAAIGTLTVSAIVGWRVRFAGARLVGWGSLDTRGRAALTVAAIMGTTLNLAMFQAFSRVPVAIVLLCFYLYPALVAAGSAVLGWERLDRPRLAALALALAGMVAVVAGGEAIGTGGGIDPVGVGLALSAALSQTVFVLISRHGYRAVPSDQAMGLILGVSALLPAIIAIGGGSGAELGRPLAVPELLVLLFFGGAFAAGLSSWMFLAGIRWIGPVRAGILMLVEPLVGVVLAAIFLGEALGPVQVAGGAAILAAAVLIQRAQPAEAAILPAAEPEGDAVEADRIPA
jgi:drug/metabolite transporter (DMT)-like permease